MYLNVHICADTYEVLGVTTHKHEPLQFEEKNGELTNVLLVRSNKSKINCVPLLYLNKVHIVGLMLLDQFRATCVYTLDSKHDSELVSRELVKQKGFV